MEGYKERIRERKTETDRERRKKVVYAHLEKEPFTDNLKLSIFSKLK